MKPVKQMSSHSDICYPDFKLFLVSINFGKPFFNLSKSTPIWFVVLWVPTTVVF